MLTSDYDDEEIEEIYDKIESLIKDKKNYYIILGDFNARIGSKELGEHHIGNYGIGRRNERGQMLANFTELHKMYIANTLFTQKKRRQWTWESPKGNRHQIDYILVNNRKSIMACKAIGMSKCDTRSDHRLVRLTLNIKCKTKKRHSSNKKIISKENAQRIINELNEENWNRRTLNGYDNLRDMLNEITKKVRTDVHETRTRLKPETLQTIKERKRLIQEGKNVRHLSKKLRKMIQDDYQDYNNRKAIEAAEKMASIKKARMKTSLSKEANIGMKDTNGNLQRNMQKIKMIVHDFYTKLFSSTKTVNKIEGYTQENVPTIMGSEVVTAIKRMPNGKAVGKDKITMDILKEAPSYITDTIATHFNNILITKEIPNDWKKSNTTLIYKKGDKEDIGNYRPICIMSQMSKLFSRVLLNRISKQLDEGNRREQAGFRKGFSTMDHIHVVSQIIEKAKEYQIPLSLLFIDFQKAFDSVETNAVLNALHLQAIPTDYVNIIEQLYQDCDTDISLNDIQTTVSVKRGVKQGDVLSPNLFSSTLEIILRNLDLPGGININGESLQYLLFADDIVLFAHSPDMLERMINLFNEETSKIGLIMHPGKTQWMKNNIPHGNTEESVKLNNIKLTKVENYIYLGRNINMENDIYPEIKRRKRAGWQSFVKLKNILMNSKLTSEVKAQIFNTHILPSLTYAAETWGTTECHEHELSIIQRQMERKITGVKIHHRISNKVLREKSKVKDIVDAIYEAKNRWAGHIARRSDNRWTKRITEWRPYNYTRHRGRPAVRWSDPLTKLHGTTWLRKAQDRNKWRKYDLRSWRPGS